MLAQRTMQQSLRRVTTRSGLLPRLAAPGAIASHSQIRPVATETLKPTEGHEILAQQRLRRPVSPHLSIYRPQITWIPSITHRLTGSILSGSIYIFGFGYLVAPLFGWHLESHALVATMAGLPLVAKMAVKSFFGFPFMFHCLNGVRHLVWDTSIGLTNKAIAASGWTVVAASVLGTIGLLMV